MAITEIKMNDKRKTFNEYYNSYCKENRVKSKIQLFDEKNLEIIADRLVIQDWKLLIKALKSENSLHSIVIISKFLNKKCNQRVGISNKQPDFLEENLLHSIIEAIKECIKNSQLMCYVHLEGLPLNKYIKIICDGISKQNNLQHLSLRSCYLTDQELTLLCQSICKHIGLQTLNLTSCGITYNGAREISMVVRSQKFARYGETWKQSLRYRLPQPDILPGLRRITLNDNNKIGDDGFKLILNELIDDLWIKAIDFQNCGLTNSLTGDILDLINTNPTLKVLDIRRNNITKEFIKEVFEKLKNNLFTSDDDSYSWLNNSASSTSTTNYNSKQKANVKIQRSYSSPVPNLNICSSLPLKNLISHKTSSYPVISELKMTKYMLEKVSSSRLEEQITQKKTENEQIKFKRQLNKIRNCLKKHDGQINIKKGNSNSLVSKMPNKSSKTEINKDLIILKKNDKILHYNTSEDLNTENNSVKSMKLLLIIPTITQDSTTEKFTISSSKTKGSSKYGTPNINKKRSIQNKKKTKKLPQSKL